MDELVCNFKKCRKSLKGTAWVTSCSHVFCEEDGAREFGKAFVCPACETNLAGRYDIVRTDLSPSDQYKSMVLAGLKPETIMEVASRALAFWSYQVHQEKAFQCFVAQKAREARSQTESYFSSVTTKLQHEITGLRADVASKSKEISDSKSKLAEVNEKLQEKTRQHQKLQSMHDTLKRRSLQMNFADDGGNYRISPSPVLRSQANDVRLDTAEDHFRRPLKYVPRPRFQEDAKDCDNFQLNTDVCIRKIQKSNPNPAFEDTQSVDGSNIPIPAPTHIDINPDDKRGYSD